MFSGMKGIPGSQEFWVKEVSGGSPNWNDKSFIYAGTVNTPPPPQPDVCEAAEA